MVIRGKVAFNALPAGSIAEFGICKFVKICDAQINTPTRMQSPDAVDLDDFHYIVIAADAVCEVLKTPQDPKYCNNCDCDLLYDCDK